MNSTVRIASIVPQVTPLDPMENKAAILEGLLKEAEMGPDIALFPALALTGASAGDLFAHQTTQLLAKDALHALAAETAENDALLLVGVPVVRGGRVVKATAVLQRGAILCQIAPPDVPADGELLDAFTLFRCGDVRFAVLSCDPEALCLYAGKLKELGCDLVLVPYASPAKAGDKVAQGLAASALSAAFGGAVVLCGIGPGETSAPHIYRGAAAAYECGALLDSAAQREEPFSLVVDIDHDLLKTGENRGPFYYEFPPRDDKKGVCRAIHRNPFLPAPYKSDPDAYLTDLLDLQVRALVSRLGHTGIEKLVLGVSGGLDSTLALLVAARALDRLGLPRQNLIGVTLPGFGTSDRTYFNALALLEALGATGIDIPIRGAVTQHFEDIGHDPADRDVTYENAQARERTQILFDLANQEGGLVVGTGDLSEAALGFCTFGGDHLSNFNVNACVPKTLVRSLVELASRSDLFADCAETLCDILETPVSPELLPPDESGDVAQKTEEILGPYELHDFFLYYFLQYGMKPSKIYYYACIAFAPEYDSSFIKEKLRLFLRRFFGAQFKRASSSEAADLTAVNLETFQMPADARADAFIGELERFDF